MPLCAYSECAVGADEELATDACSVCGAQVHHLCSNQINGDGPLDARYCSLSCFKHTPASSDTGASTIKRRFVPPSIRPKSNLERPNESNDDGSDGSKQKSDGKARFGYNDDVTLMTLVVRHQPFDQPHGKAVLAWNKVVSHLNKTTGRGFKQRQVQDRVTVLAKRHDSDEKRAKQQVALPKATPNRRGF
jgi:hypothetical protein